MAIGNLTAGQVLAMQEEIISEETTVMVNLEADLIADPNHDNSGYRNEDYEITDAEVAGENMVAVSFHDGSRIVFPTDHILEVSTVL